MSIELAQVYTDFGGLDALRKQARDDKEAALDEVSRQFESMFMQMMLKSMRKASLGTGLMDSQQSEFYRDMYDQQLTVELSKQQGLGLADVLKRQLGGGPAVPVSEMTLEDYRGQPVLTTAARSTQSRSSSDPISSADSVEQVRESLSLEAMPATSLDGTPEAFVEALWPAASEAAASIGIAPEALLSQAALETGWGQHVIRDGRGSSHNLFGIKADHRWDGDKVEVSTLEYRDGQPLKVRADFRAYDSYAESFKDYVAFVSGHARYADALSQTHDPKAYFKELQQAGYATDPAYAEKISRIMDGSTMRQVRAKQEALKAG